MAMRLGRSDGDVEEMHDINVTPFIDVMLVLLIIFMIAAPLATVDIAVNLPTSTAERQQRPDKPIVLTLRADLTLTVGEEAVSRDAIAAALDGASGGDREQRVFLRADKVVAYGALMEVMNALRAAGYLKVALVGLDGGGR
jgi:TonB system transport protein ExbD (group 1)